MSYNHKLTAKNETLFVNPLNPTSSTASTTVDYKMDWPANLWRRYVGQPWTQENLIAGAANSAQAAALEKEGTRTTPPLKAGEVIQYGILTERGIDPNMPGFTLGRFADLVTIYALLQVPGPSNWIDPRPTMADTGGTFHFRRVGTTKPTYFVMKVGREAAVAGQFGMFDIKTPIETHQSPLGSTHEAEAAPLVPGTHYHVVVRLSDDQGNWSVIREEFDTRKRKVEIEFEKIKIHDDSDFDLFGLDDDGEAKFWIKVFKGQDIIKEFPFGEINVSDKSYNSAKNEIPLNFKHTVDPEAYDGSDPGIGIGAEGKEYDPVEFLGITLFYSTDESEFRVSGRPHVKSDYINFPTGKGKENVADGPLSVTAWPINGDGSLHFTVHAKHTVNYVA